MKLAMRYHRFRLFFLRNQLTLQWYGLFFLYVFGIALWLLINSNLSNFAKRLEEGQKGQTCILLIQPKDRTRQNVTRCVEDNRQPPKKGGSNGFQFNSPGDSPVQSSEVVLPPPQPHAPSLTTKPVPSPPPNPPPKSQPVKEVVRRIETRINSMGQSECRLVGDIYWALGTCQ